MIRRAALTDSCERCDSPLAKFAVYAILADRRQQFSRFLYSREVDHVVPERAIFTSGSLHDPHDRRNLMCLCKACHVVKTSADYWLCRGDQLRYLEVLEAHHWPIDRVKTALALYGF